GGNSESGKGRSEGGKVVGSGQFLIDAEASLRASGMRMEGVEGPKAAAPQTHRAVGEVVSAGAGDLLIKHGAIPSAGMGAMTMPFRAPNGIVPPGLKKGDRVLFEFSIKPDVENQITYPLTTTMLSVPGAKTVRGYSFFGDSFVYILFEDGTDPYWARSRVLEYLNQVQSRLPPQAKTSLGPDATGVGWVYEYALVDRSGRMDLSELRALQDWFLKYE